MWKLSSTSRRIDLDYFSVQNGAAKGRFDDSSLLGEGARVLTRTMQKITEDKSGLKRKIRDRMKSVKRRVVEIALAARQKGPEGEERKKKAYRRLLTVTRQVVNQAQRVMEEIGRCGGRRRRMRQELVTMVDRVRQVIGQTRARIFGGETHHHAL